MMTDDPALDPFEREFRQSLDGPETLIDDNVLRMFRQLTDKMTMSDRDLRHAMSWYRAGASDILAALTLLPDPLFRAILARVFSQEALDHLRRLTVDKEAE